jgi:hypothetical protein
MQFAESAAEAFRSYNSKAADFAGCAIENADAAVGHHPDQDLDVIALMIVVAHNRNDRYGEPFKLVKEHLHLFLQAHIGNIACQNKDIRFTVNPVQKLPDHPDRVSLAVQIADCGDFHASYPLLKILILSLLWQRFFYALHLLIFLTPFLLYH